MARKKNLSFGKVKGTLGAPNKDTKRAGEAEALTGGRRAPNPAAAQMRKAVANAKRMANPAMDTMRKQMTTAKSRANPRVSSSVRLPSPIKPTTLKSPRLRVKTSPPRSRYNRK